MAPIEIATRCVSNSLLRQLAKERPLPVRVIGSSMAPKLRYGDVVAVESARCLLPGDIIAFRQERTGRLLVHRVLGYRPFGSRWALVVQGDACEAHDGAVFFDQVIGRVRAADVSQRVLDISLAERFRAMRRWLRLVMGWMARRTT